MSRNRGLFSRTLFVLAVCTPLLAGPALGDDLADRRAVAADIVAITTTNTMIDAIHNSVWAVVKADLRSKNPEAPEAVFSGLETVLRESLAVNVAEMANVIVDFYADSLALDELKELKAFYQSDVGEKLVALTPKLMGEAMPVMMQQVQRMMPEIMSEIQKLARQRGLKVDA